MKRDKGFENLSGQMSSDEIGIGWLNGMTLRTSNRATLVRPHLHQHMEVILCLRGELSYEIGDRPPVSLGADKGLIINAHTQHALRHNAESPGERIGLHLLRTTSSHHDFAVFKAKDYADFYRILSAAASHPFRLSSQLKSDARKLAEFLKRPTDSISSSERSFIRILCCSILYHLVQTLSGPQPAANDPQPMDEAVRFLEERYANPFDVKELIRRMGYSRASLYTLFKRHTGLTPNDYLIRLRVEKAKLLLESSDQSITDISTATGFSSSEYFSAVFRRYVGQTPSGYRSNPNQGN